MSAAPASPARRSLDLAVEVLTDALDLALDRSWAGVADRMEGADHLLEAARMLGVMSTPADANPDPVMLVLLSWDDDDERWQIASDVRGALRGEPGCSPRMVMDALLAATAAR